MQIYFDKERGALVIDGMGATLIPKTLIKSGDTGAIKVHIQNFNIDCKDIPAEEYGKISE